MKNRRYWLIVAVILLSIIVLCTGVKTPDSLLKKIKATRILVLINKCCNPRKFSVIRERLCYKQILKSCRKFEDPKCYKQRLTTKPCNTLQQTGGYKQSYSSAVARAVPFLSVLGWKNVAVAQTLSFVSNKAKGGKVEYVDKITTAVGHNCSGSTFKSHTYREIKHADVIIVDNNNGNDIISWIAETYPKKRLIIIDTTDNAALGQKLLKRSPKITEDRVLAVLKPTVLQPPELQNGLIYNGKAHSFFINKSLGWLDQRLITHNRPPLASSVLGKIHALVPQMYRFAYPLDCGGSQKYTRFIGFFADDENYPWSVPPLSQRSVDVAFWGKIDTGMYKRHPELTQHRRELVEKLEEFSQRYHMMYDVRTGKKAGLLDYGSYINMLLNTKVFVSPYGAGEWSHKDYEAMMCGCLVVKPRAHNFRAYENVFVPNETVISVEADWSDLTMQLEAVLKDLDHAQRLVSTAQNRLLESTPRKYAADLDKMLMKVLTPA